MLSVTLFNHDDSIRGIDLKKPGNDAVTLRQGGSIPSRSGAAGWEWSDARQAFIYWRQGTGVYVVKLSGSDWRTGTVNVYIQTSSINTNNATRDADLRSPNFFAVDSFPLITFESTGIVAADSNFEMGGLLTIKGRTHPVVLSGEYRGLAKDMNGKQRVAFEGSTLINRKQYNLNWNQTVDGGAMRSVAAGPLQAPTTETSSARKGRRVRTSLVRESSSIRVHSAAVAVRGIGRGQRGFEGHQVDRAELGAFPWRRMRRAYQVHERVVTGRRKRHWVESVAWNRFGA
jgi:hypothetical protein